LNRNKSSTNVWNWIDCMLSQDNFKTYFFSLIDKHLPTLAIIVMSISLFWKEVVSHIELALDHAPSLGIERTCLVQIFSAFVLWRNKRNRSKIYSFICNVIGDFILIDYDSAITTLITITCEKMFRFNVENNGTLALYLSKRGPLKEPLNHFGVFFWSFLTIWGNKILCWTNLGTAQWKNSTFLHFSKKFFDYLSQYS